jgi:hypothetical protein
MEITFRTVNIVTPFLIVYVFHAQIVKQLLRALAQRVDPVVACWK